MLTFELSEDLLKGLMLETKGRELVGARLSEDMKLLVEGFSVRLEELLHVSCCLLLVLYIHMS